MYELKCQMKLLGQMKLKRYSREKFVHGVIDVAHEPDLNNKNKLVTVIL